MNTVPNVFTLYYPPEKMTGKNTLAYHAGSFMKEKKSFLTFWTGLEEEDENDKKKKKNGSCVIL